MAIGRNDPCPCGSGKKYKKCCLGRADPATPAEPAPHSATESLLGAARSSFERGELSTARFTVDRVLKLAPDELQALVLAGNIELQDKNFEEAARYTGRVLELQPEHPLHLYHHATVLAQTGQGEQAVELFRRALELKPDFHLVYNNLGNTLRDLGRSEEAVECYREVFRHEVRDLSTLSHVLVSMHQFSFDDHDTLYEMHCSLGGKLTALGGDRPLRRQTVCARANGKIRLGYVSPRFSREIVGNFFLPVFDAHDRDKFEIYLYSATRRTDDLTEYFSRHADKWTDACGMSDNALCRAIVEDEIDILIDLAGHAPENRLAAIARKPAPVQLAMIDYFDTTGIEAMDYYLTDHYSTPDGGKQRFVERLLYQDQPRLVYRAPDYAPEPRIRDADAGGIVFGSFNRHQKIIPQVVELWSQLLLAVPDATLLLKNTAFAFDEVQENYLARFEQHGVSRERIRFRGKSPHAEMLAEYGEIDIALDTFPYNGGLTTCEALWMGTPVLALEGERIISRQSAAMLESVGLGSFVAHSATEFVEIGRHWATRREELCALRRGLRQAMAESPLTDAGSYTAQLERHLQRIWSEYLDQRGAAKRAAIDSGA